MTQRHPAEARAVRHYRLRGYRILATNVWAGRYELDVVARRGRRVVFCEVKAKRGRSWGEPLEWVTKEKRRRIRQAAAAFLAARPELRGLEVRFDVVVERDGRLRRFPSAF